jgi:peptide/nickel transport system permease protein
MDSKCAVVFRGYNWSTGLPPTISMQGQRREGGAILRVLGARLALLGFMLVAGLTLLFLAVVGGSLVASSGGLLDFLLDAVTLRLGEASIVSPTWQQESTYPIVIESTSVSEQIATRVGPWIWILGWTSLVTLLLSLPIGILLAQRNEPASLPAHTTLGHVIRLLPVFFLADLATVMLAYSRRLFNIDWDTLLVESPPVLTGMQTMPDLSSVSGVLIASKWAIVPALAASSAVIPTAVRAVRAAVTQIRGSAAAAHARSRGVPDDSGTHRAVTVWLLEALPASVAVIQVAALVAETAAGNLVGLARLVGAAYVAGDVRLLAGLFLLLAIPIILADLVRTLGIFSLTGSRRRDPATLVQLSFPPPDTGWARLRKALPSPERLRPWRDPPSGLKGKVRTAGPALLLWFLGGLVLLILQLGAVFDALTLWYSGLSLPKVPTLVSWATIPDADYRTPSGNWVGGFLGLTPAASWLVRLLVAEAYLLAIGGWLWSGWRIIHVLGRGADEPLLAGPVLDVLRTEWRVSIGLGVVCLIIAAGLFAPATGPSMADDPTKSYDQQEVSYVEDGEIRRTLRLGTVLSSQPDSTAEGTPGPMEYDAYDRFHPFGTVWLLSSRPLGGEVSQTRDLFAWWIREIQSLLPYLVVIGGITFIGGLSVTLLGRLRQIEGGLTLLADLLALLPLVPALLVVREFIATAEMGSPIAIPSPVPGGTGDIPPPAESLQFLLLGVLGALLVGRAVRRHALQTDRFRDRIRRVVGPLTGYTALLTAGGLLYVYIVRLFYRNRISTESLGPSIPAIDPRAALNFTWIDTALWYTNTVPVIATVTLLVALGLFGDGLRRATGTRGDPEGDGAVEPASGGGGT